MSSRSFVLLTTAGPDRPGIVQTLSAWILEHGGNIEESRMARLGGDFATLILVSGGPQLPATLESAKASLEDRQLTVLLHEVTESAATPREPSLRYRLQATALDHPGIVHRVTGLLSDQSINIVEAETTTDAAPFTGSPVFQLRLEIDIPSSVGIRGLRQRLDEIGDDQNIDFVLEAV